MEEPGAKSEGQRKGGSIQEFQQGTEPASALLLIELTELVAVACLAHR
jgi:hypothetical protein